MFFCCFLAHRKKKIRVEDDGVSEESCGRTIPESRPPHFASFSSSSFFNSSPSSELKVSLEFLSILPRLLYISNIQTFSPQTDNNTHTHTHTQTNGTQQQTRINFDSSFNITFRGAVASHSPSTCNALLPITEPHLNAVFISHSHENEPLICSLRILVGSFTTQIPADAFPQNYFHPHFCELEEAVKKEEF